MELADFISRRKDEITNQLAPLRTELSEIRAKIKELEEEFDRLEKASKAIGMVNRLRIDRRKTPGITIKQAILKVLQDFPQGLTALDILANINARYELNLVRTSLSPQLTRLKRDGAIISHRHQWKILRPNKEGPDLESEPSEKH